MNMQEHRGYMGVQEDPQTRNTVCGKRNGESDEQEGTHVTRDNITNQEGELVSER